MIQRLSPTVRNVALAAIAALVLWFAWSVRSVLNPLIAGYFLAFCVHPFVQRLERRGWSRKRSVNTIFFAAGALVTVAGVMVFVQARKLVLDAGPTLERIGASADEFLDENEDAIRYVLDGLGLRSEGTAPAGEGAPATGRDPERPPGGEAGEAETEPAEEPPPEEAEHDEGAEAREEGHEGELDDEEDLTWSEILGRVGRSAFGGEGGASKGLQAAEGGWLVLRKTFGTGFAFLSFLFLLPIYTWFLLFELGSIHGFVRRYIPRRHREHVTRVGAQIGEVIATFFRGRLTVCLLKGLILVVGLAIAQVDYAVLLGLAGGFLSLVPFIGPLLTGVVAFLLSLPDHGFLPSLIGTVVVFAIAELVEGYVLIPKILGDSLGLHPVVVLVSVFAGGAALGMFGFLIAIPLTAALVILAREFVLPALAQLADEERGEPPKKPPAGEGRAPKRG